MSGQSTSAFVDTMGNGDSRSTMMDTGLGRTMMEVEVEDEGGAVASLLSSARVPSFRNGGDSAAPVVPAEGSGVGFGLPRASGGGATTASAATTTAGNASSSGSIATRGTGDGGHQGGGSGSININTSSDAKPTAKPKSDPAAAERRRRSRIAKIMRMSSVSWVEKQRLIQSVRSPRPTGDSPGGRQGHIPSSAADGSSSAVTGLGFAGSSSVAVQTPEPPQLGDLDVTCEHYVRGSDIYAECCRRWVPCRRCHDENSGHKMIRADIRKMRCRHCSTEQPVAAKCRNKVCMMGWGCPGSSSLISLLVVRERLTHINPAILLLSPSPPNIYSHHTALRKEARRALLRRYVSIYSLVSRDVAASRAQSPSSKLTPLYIHKYAT